MVASLLYKGGYESSYTAVATGDLNVATGNFGTLSAAVNNSSNKYINALALFSPGGNWTPTGGPILVWILPSWDGGTTYEATPSAIGTVRQPDFSITVEAGSSINKNWTADGVLLKPGYQKFIAYNSTGATVPSTASILLYPYITQIA